MLGIAHKRIIKDLEIIRKNKEELASRGIYVNVNEADVCDIAVLIVPRDKREGDLRSPYTFGNFMFHMTFGPDFPMSPPSVEFHPKQNFMRMHPNYYEGGKVCLSVINTWATPDWTPSTSIMTLINVLEERFNENAVCFEPAFSAAGNDKKASYNTAVEYAKYKVCLMEVMKSPIAKRFVEEIKGEFAKNKVWLVERLEELDKKHGGATRPTQVAYSHAFVCNYREMLAAFKRFCY